MLHALDVSVALVQSLGACRELELSLACNARASMSMANCMVRPTDRLLVS